jgi:hypothetical protein
MKKLSNQVFESKINGAEEASKIVTKWRSGLFRKMSDDELENFRKTIAKMLNLKM